MKVANDAGPRRASAAMGAKQHFRGDFKAVMVLPGHGIGGNHHLFNDDRAIIGARADQQATGFRRPGRARGPRDHGLVVGLQMHRLGPGRRVMAIDHFALCCHRHGRIITSQAKPHSMEPPAEPVDLRLADDIAGQRLDKALAAAMAPMSRMRVQALIQDGKVRLNDAICTDPARKLAGGERINVEVPAPVKAQPAAEAMALNILYEDADLVVLDKPAGLVVHPAPGHHGGTLVNALIAHCGDQLSGIGGVARPGIVHRLDKDTSGVMVVAKSDAAHQGLAALFASHDIERVYTALVWGRPTPLAGRIEAAIGRHARDRKKMAVQQPGRGRHAATRYRVKRVFGGGAKAFAAEVECQLETGRTHQVRVHLASIGNPLIGDRYYGGGRVLGLQAMAQFPRQALHAQVLGFRHPISGAALRFETPPPADMQALAHALEKEKGVA